MLNGRNGFAVSGCAFRVSIDIYIYVTISFQYSRGVYPGNWRTSEMRQWMPSDIMRLSLSIPQRCPSSRPRHKVSSSSEAGRT